MRVELSSIIAREPEWVWDMVRRSETLEFVARPLIRFSPVDNAFPPIWTPGDHRALMTLFGVVPIGMQTIGIEYPKGEDGYVLRDNGRGTMISVWDHWIFVELDEHGGTRYTDRVDVEAGVLTPFVSTFARAFYEHRQRRWQELAARAA